MSQANPTEASTPRPNEFNLVWIDMEMTGLDPDNDRIIEVAAVVTDANLNVLAEGPVIAVHQSDATLDKMDNWNKGTHGRSGLIDRVAQARERLLKLTRTELASRLNLAGSEVESLLGLVQSRLDFSLHRLMD